MACRGCSSDGCSCSVTGVGAISVSGSGTPTIDPYVIEFDLDDGLAGVPTDDVTDCSALNDPHVLVKLGTGDTYFIPFPCNEVLDTPVPGNAFAFTWSASTDDDPSITEIRFDDSTYADVTTIYVSTEDIAGTSVEDWLLSNTEGALKVYSRTNPQVWATFFVSGVSTGVSNVIEFAVSYVDGNGLFNGGLPGDTVFDFTPQIPMPPFGVVPVKNLTISDVPYTIGVSDIGHLLVFDLNVDPDYVYIDNDSTVSFPVGARIEFTALDKNIDISPLDIADILYDSSSSVGYGQRGVLTNVGTDIWQLSVA